MHDKQIVVPICTLCGRSKWENSEVRLFMIPKNNRRIREQWIENCNIPESQWHRKRTLVCDIHFEREYFTGTSIAPNAVPTLKILCSDEKDHKTFNADYISYLAKQTQQEKKPSKKKKKRVFYKYRGKYTNTITKYNITALNHEERNILTRCINKGANSWYGMNFNFNDSELINIPRETRNCFVIELLNGSTIYIESIQCFR